MRRAGKAQVTIEWIKLSEGHFTMILLFLLLYEAAIFLGLTQMKTPINLIFFNSYSFIHRLLSRASLFQ